MCLAEREEVRGRGQKFPMPPGATQPKNENEFPLKRVQGDALIQGEMVFPEQDIPWA